MKYTPNDNPNPQISFGNGGGVVGMVTEYVLFQNGQLFKKEGLGDQYTELGRIDQQQAKQIFTTWESLNIDGIKQNTPGNRYSFIGLKTKDKTHNITWGNDANTDKNVVTLYQILNHLAKSSK